jgi:hypothetical protein
VLTYLHLMMTTTFPLMILLSNLFPQKTPLMTPTMQTQTMKYPITRGKPTMQTQTMKYPITRGKPTTTGLATIALLKAIRLPHEIALVTEHQKLSNATRLMPADKPEA